MTKDKKKSNFINIGGAPYSRKALLNGLGVWIVGYDINTERHLIIRDLFGGNIRRIELDNYQLSLREKYQRNYK